MLSLSFYLSIQFCWLFTEIILLIFQFSFCVPSLLAKWEGRGKRVGRKFFFCVGTFREKCFFSLFYLYKALDKKGFTFIFLPRQVENFYPFIEWHLRNGTIFSLIYCFPSLFFLCLAFFHFPFRMKTVYNFVHLQINVFFKVNGRNWR